MKNKSTLTIRVPEELKSKIETLAAQQGISINQFALYAFSKEIGELESAQSFRRMTQGINKKELFSRIDEILSRVPDRDVPEWDRITDE
jgi:uncharacterized protein (DUF1778 family)